MCLCWLQKVVVTFRSVMKTLVCDHSVEAVEYVSTVDYVFVFAARSSFFDVNMGAVDSPDPLKESKEAVGEGSCPVLSGDTEAEAVRVVC